MQVTAPLEKIGLDKKEATLYLTLASLGSASAYKIAKVSGIKRPTAYVLLETLREKGLVLKTPHAKRSMFVARPLLEYVEERKKDLRAAESFAASITHAKESVPNVLYFEGVQGHKDARYYRLPPPGSTNRSIYGHLENTGTILEQYVQWHHEMMKRDISFRILVSKKDLKKYFADLEELATQYSSYEVRTSDSFDFPKNISVEIESDLIRINYPDTLESVIVENKRVVQVYSQLFDLAWEHSEKLL